MLNQKTIEIIKSTVPVLEQHGQSITTKFYEMMFTNHPELLNIFNHANQKQGRQQAALANTVYAAAKYIDNLGAILPVVKQIAHKHRSLGIKPEHYPIVGEHLILAIKEVLKEAATTEIIDAWTEAYQVIANAFIGIEEDMYKTTESKEGGWREFKKFTVVKKERESEVITSFYLKPSDGAKLVDFVPGQYISVKVAVEGDEYTHIRQYSLSDSPEKDYYRISIKRESGNEIKPAGVVSNFMHDQVNEGDQIDISAPAGDFVLENSKNQPLVLLSGGVGITPMMSMYNHLSQNGENNDVTFIHAAINGVHHAFKQNVKENAKQNNFNHYFFYEKPEVNDTDFYKQGYVTSSELEKLIPNKNSIVYMCGPVPFMQAMYEHLLEIGLKKENVRFEFFGPALTLKEKQTI